MIYHSTMLVFLADIVYSIGHFCHAIATELVVTTEECAAIGYRIIVRFAGLAF